MKSFYWTRAWRPVGWIFSLCAVIVLLGSVHVSSTGAQPVVNLEEDVLPAVVQIAVRIIETEAGRTEEQFVPRGSGAVISPTGVVITANHVLDVSDLTELSAEREAAFKSQGRDRTVRVVENQYVLLFSERDEPPRPRFTAELAQSDPMLDLAALRITGGSAGQPIDPTRLDLAFVPLGDSDAVGRQDRIWIVGYPSITSTSIVDDGTVNAFETAAGISGRAWIVTDATVSGGSSGGPAVNESGQVVGIAITASELECRPGDTNRDGVTDELDVGCIPVGSAVAKLRPINLAMPLLAAFLTPTPEPSVTVIPNPTVPSTATSIPTPTPTPPPTFAPATERPASTSSVSTGSWTSPLWGYSLSWDTSWATIPDPRFELALSDSVSQLGFYGVPGGDPSTCAESQAAAWYSAGGAAWGAVVVGGGPDASGGSSVVYEYYDLGVALEVNLTIYCYPLESVNLVVFWWVPINSYFEELPVVWSVVQAARPPAS